MLIVIMLLMLNIAICTAAIDYIHYDAMMRAYDESYQLDIGG